MSSMVATGCPRMDAYCLAMTMESSVKMSRAACATTQSSCDHCGSWAGAASEKPVRMNE